MKLLFGTQSWLNALWILVALLSGPIVVASVWLVVAIAAESGVPDRLKSSPTPIDSDSP